MIRGFAIVAIAFVALVVVVAGVIGAGMHQLAEETRMANESWHPGAATTEPSSTTKPADATPAAQREQSLAAEFDSIDLLPKDARCHGDVQIISRATGPEYRRGGVGNGFFAMNPEAAEHMRRRALLRGNENLTYLTGLRTTDDWAEWEIDVPKAGKYEIDLTYACPDREDGASFLVKIGDKEISLTTESTRSETNFRVITIAKLALTAGKSVLTLRPSATSQSRHAFMNLRGVQLIPAS